MSEQDASLILEKISNLHEKFSVFTKDNTGEHQTLIVAQKHTNGRVKRLELAYAGLVGAASALSIVWVIATFIIQTRT